MWTVHAIQAMVFNIITSLVCCRLDKEDAFHRAMERRKRKAERWGNNGVGGDGGFIHEADD